MRFTAPSLPLTRPGAVAAPSRFRGSSSMMGEPAEAACRPTASASKGFRMDVATRGSRDVPPAPSSVRSSTMASASRGSSPHVPTASAPPLPSRCRARDRETRPGRRERAVDRASPIRGRGSICSRARHRAHWKAEGLRVWRGTGRMGGCRLRVRPGRRSRRAPVRPRLRGRRPSRRAPLLLPPRWRRPTRRAGALDPFTRALGGPPVVGIPRRRAGAAGAGPPGEGAGPRAAAGGPRREKFSEKTP